MKRRVFTLLAAGLLIPAAFAKHPKIAKDLDTTKGGTVDVIVQFITPPTTKHHDKVAKKGGNLKLKLGAAAVYSLAPSELEDLATDPDVAYITPDRGLKAHLEYAQPTLGADMSYSNGWDGTGVGVAVIDSGVNDHPDFKDRVNCTTNRLVLKENFVAGETTTADLYGHGTHVAGIIAGVGRCAESNRTKTFRGIAPDAKIISLRVLNAEGAGTDSAVIAAIDRAIALKSTYNIKVINLSLGRGVFESYTLDPLCQAAERAWKAGIVVVASAGNYGRFAATQGYGTITSPGNDPFVLTVGAMNDKKSLGRSDDVMTTFSSKGPTLFDHVVKPDLVAPGNSIISLMSSTSSNLATLFPGNIVNRDYYKSGVSGNSSYYMQLSGTSMAAPMASGAAAVLFGHNSSLTPNQVKARLMKTATKAFLLGSTINDPGTGAPIYVQYDLFTVGAGYLDVWAALNNTDTMTTASTTPLSPKVGLNSAGDAYIIPTSLVWGDSLFGVTPWCGALRSSRRSAARR